MAVTFVVPIAAAAMFVNIDIHHHSVIRIKTALKTCKLILTIIH